MNIETKREYEWNRISFASLVQIDILYSYEAHESDFNMTMQVN